MPFKIYHQCGHNAVWNRDVYTEEAIGSGLIFSPVHEKMSQIINYNDVVKSSSLFDPQFYLPNSQKKKLQEYPFFPDVVAQGFQTSDFEVRALDAARLCIEFQIEQGFGKILIPARYHEQMVTDFCDRQDAYSVVPHIAALQENQGHGKPVYITLPVTSHMIADEEYRTSLLNWVTGYSEIDGVYLIVSNDRNTKQITDSSCIFNNLQFARELRDAGLDILAGYCNSESLLYSLIDEASATFGAYENTRIFSTDKFVVSDDVQNGPRARIYLQGLHNWVQLEQAREIRDGAPEVWNLIYSPSEESEEALDSPTPWHFGKSQLYTHHFRNMHELVEQLNGLDPIQAHATLRARFIAARNYYAEIENAYIDLEPHGSGAHIEAWLTGINQYARSNFSA